MADNNKTIPAKGYALRNTIVAGNVLAIIAWTMCMFCFYDAVDSTSLVEFGKWFSAAVVFGGLGGIMFRNSGELYHEAG